MSPSSIRSAIAPAVILAAAAALALGVALADAQAQGPSSSQSAYVVPVATGVQTRAILSVGDAAGGYRMAGFLDGLGAFSNGDGSFTLLANHELGATAGTTRAHGAKGAFVSRWTIDEGTLAVAAGSDLIRRVATWNAGSGTHNSPAAGVAISRLCSADLPDPAALYHPKSKQGHDGRIFLSGEEVGSEGRLFAHLVDGPEAGTSYELPHLGKLSYENSLASAATGNKTVVISTDDSTPGQVYVYVGHKRKSGNPVERAGLTGGTLYGVRVPGAPAEDRATGVGGSSAPFELARLGDVSARSGAALQAASAAAGVTEFLRPEDGHWDPQNPDDFYFVTTDRFDQVKAGTGSQVGRSRLWRLRFDNVQDPLSGGAIEMLLDGTEPQQMLDNMTVDGHGHVLMQEDPGNQALLARVWQYDLATGGLKLIAQHDPARFLAPAAPFSRDEESSGIIDASDILGAGWFLLDVQAHYAIPDPDHVDAGQLLALFNPDSAGP